MNFLNLWRRELATYFHSPIAYVVTVFFLVVTGFNFWFLINLMSSEQGQGTSVITQLFGSLFFWIPFLVIVPIVTMRVFAEEVRSGTIEALMTTPVTETEIVLAKYAGALAFFVLMWAPTACYAYVLQRFSVESTPIDFGPIVGGYIGTFLVGMFYLSVGILCSALTRNQIVAAIVCFALVCVAFFAGFLHYRPPSDGVRLVSRYASSVAHMLEFSRGTIDTRPIVLYLTGTIFMLFTTVRVVEARRW